MIIERMRTCTKLDISIKKIPKYAAVFPFKPAAKLDNYR